MSCCCVKLVQKCAKLRFLIILWRSNVITEIQVLWNGPVIRNLFFSMKQIRLCVFVFVLYFNDCLILNSSSNNNKLISFNTPHHVFGNISFDVTGTVVIVQGQECNSWSFLNQFVMVKQPQCSPETRIRLCQKGGCLGLIIEDAPYEIPGWTAHGYFDGSDRSDLSAPMVSIGLSDGKKLKDILKKDGLAQFAL